MKYKDIEYEYLGIGLNARTLNWITSIANLRSDALSVWLRSLLTILTHDNKMLLKDLTHEMCGHNIPKREVLRVLVASKCFETDETGEYIHCSERCLEGFLVIPSSGKNSLANDLAQEKIPKLLAPTRQVVNPVAQQERNIKQRKNNAEEKEKKAKALKRKNFAELSSSAVKEEEKAYYRDMLEHCPRVCQLDDMMSYEQYLKLLSQGYTKRQVAQVLEAMENHKELLRRYTSAYLTARNWLSRRSNSGR